MKQLLLLCLFLSAAFAASAGEDYFSKTISLDGPATADDGGWHFLGCEPQVQAKLPAMDSEDWQPIAVPGDVNAALLALGKIPDPHFDTQGRAAYWITAKEWWYARTFDAPVDLARANRLIFEDVDGPAEVWLNGRRLGEMKNYFHPHDFSVNSILKEKANQLLVRFQSINSLLGGQRLDELAGWRDRRAFLRKPQYNFGWDWALPLPGIGLGGAVRLESGGELKFEELSVQPFNSGRVDFNFQVSRPAKAQGFEIRLHITGHGADITNIITRQTHKTYCSVNIPNPQLWWPNGYGAPNLYDYTVELLVGGVVVDRRAGRLGLRESRTEVEPFTPEAGMGMSYNIAINGERIFVKGANWIPMEIWPATIRPENYEFYLRKVKEANFNMIRVWGGGIYEREKFYQLCDELGIMVWQDFMFAGAGYPLDSLRDEIVAEAEFQVKRLRLHPSVVLWCGMNEDIYSWTYPNAGAAKAVASQSDIVSDKSDGGTNRWAVNRYKFDPLLLQIMLRGVVANWGLDIPFVTSSPASRDDYGNFPVSGNHHLSCWKYALFQSDGKPENYRRYFDNVCSFDSEFCIQGPCDEKAFRQFLAPTNQWPPNDAWIYHIQRGHANLPHFEQTLMIAGGIFGKINSLSDYVKFGQSTHLEQTRDEYESARRDRPNNGGTMSWMFNDCWPTANWSILDYYFQPKPAYYAAKRACAPVLPIIFERKGEISFFLGNDTISPQAVKLEYGQEKLDGTAVWKKSAGFECVKNSTFKFATVPRTQLKFEPGDYLFIAATINGQRLNKVTWFPNGWKDIPWPTTKIWMQSLGQTQQGGEWLTTVKVSTERYARLCHFIDLDAPEKLSTTQTPRVWFSDNYFDLPAGGERIVTIESNRKLDLSRIKAATWLDARPNNPDGNPVSTLHTNH